MAIIAVYSPGFYQLVKANIFWTQSEFGMDMNGDGASNFDPDQVNLSFFPTTFWRGLLDARKMGFLRFHIGRHLFPC